MPFTGSHPAAVLPLLRTGMPASALVIGSLAPDLPYYVPVQLGTFSLPADLGSLTHTTWALVSLDLALGAAAWALWHGLLAAPLVDLAPRPVRARLSGQVRTGLRPRLATGRARWTAALALVVGAATHVLWDEFTHVGRWGERHVGALSATWAGLEGYRWAQYASGIVGALVIAGHLLGWWRRTRPSSDPGPAAGPRRSWLPVLVVVGVGGVVGSWAAMTADGLRAAMFYGATKGGAGVIAATVLLSLLWRRRRPPHPG